MQGFPNASVIEITHQPPDKTWMYWARGPGIYYDIGKTIVFKKHAEVIARFVREYVSKAHAHGFDSIQFTCHEENIYKFEVVDTQNVFDPICPRHELEQRFRRGW